MTADCRLYLITPPQLDDLAAFGRTLAHALDAGDVAALQIRLKDVDDAVIAAAVDALMPIAQARGVAVILNDRPDLAARLGCDGVHVGQSDTPYAEARKIMGREAMIGVTCHDSRHLAMEAAEAGADYVAFGAFFPTTTKDAPTRAEPEILTIWQETMEVPAWPSAESPLTTPRAWPRPAPTSWRSRPGSGPIRKARPRRWRRSVIA